MEIRLLAARSEVAYVANAYAALRNELPAVSADEQDQLTREARLGPIFAALSEAQRASEYHAAQARAASRRVHRLERRLANARLAG